MNKPTVHSVFARIKNNPVVATLIILSTVVIALSSFTDATKNLMCLFSQSKRPEINGIWVADVSYDWENAHYRETFDFRGEGQELFGTASFLERKKAIQTGTVSGNKLTFTTFSREIAGSDSRQLQHEYQGRLTEGTITFFMVTTGSASEHQPIEFTARKHIEP